MHRRELLKGLALASTSALLSSCAAKRLQATLPITPCLPRVDVAPDRIIRTICGLRPYRPSGFVVRPEKIGDTLVVHNYGHGGAGITLSWGTSKLAVDMGARGHTGPVAVLGSGVVGLSTARLLQEAGFAVTIYAKDVPPNTTSNVAGGWWYPVTLFDEQFRTPAFSDQFAKACRYAFQRYQIMVGYHGHTETTPRMWETAFGYARYNGANVDLGHFIAGNNVSPIPFIKQHHDRVTHVHIKDRKLNNGPNVPFGEGDTPIIEALRLIRDNKWNIQATIEFEYPVPPGSDRMTEIAKCVQYCRNALA